MSLDASLRDGTASALLLCHCKPACYTTIPYEMVLLFPLCNAVGLSSGTAILMLLSYLFTHNTFSRLACGSTHNAFLPFGCCFTILQCPPTCLTSHRACTICSCPIQSCRQAMKARMSCVRIACFSNTPLEQVHPSLMEVLHVALLRN